MEQVAHLKAEYKMGHGHANALVAYHKAGAATGLGTSATLALRLARHNHRRLLTPAAESAVAACAPQSLPCPLFNTEIHIPNKFPDSVLASST